MTREEPGDLTYISGKLQMFIFYRILWFGNNNHQNREGITHSKREEEERPKHRSTIYH